MSRNIRIVSCLAAVMIVTSGFVLFEYQMRAPSRRSSKSNEIPTSINVLPDSATEPLSSAYVQLWAFDAPPLPGNSEVVHLNSTQPVLQLLTNSSGVAEGYLPPSFLAIAGSWVHYFSATSQNDSETSFSIQITYQFEINSSAYRVVLYSDFIPYNPETVDASSVLNITLHPNLADRPYFISYDGTPYSVSASGSMTPMISGNSSAAPSCISGGGGCNCNPVYAWDVWNSTSYDNMNLPIQFANDTGTAGASEITMSVTIGYSSVSTSFNAGEGYHSSTTLSSNYISSNGAYTSSPGILGSTGGPVYAPQTNKVESFAYNWINGNFAITNYREKEVYPCTGQHYWLNNYETVPYISSLTVQNGAFVMGTAYWGYNASNPYTSPKAEAELGIDNALASSYSTTLSVSQEVQWNEIYNTVTGNYNNIQGMINGLLGLGLSYISFVVAVEAIDGWAPGSGWGDIASTVLAISGLVSAALAVILNGVVSSSSTVFVFSAYFKNTGLPGNAQSGNSMSLTDYAINDAISYEGNLYTFPVLYGVGN